MTVSALALAGWRNFRSSACSRCSPKLEPETIDFPKIHMGWKPVNFPQQTNPLNQTEIIFSSEIHGDLGIHPCQIPPHTSIIKHICNLYLVFFQSPWLLVLPMFTYAKKTNPKYDHIDYGYFFMFSPSLITNSSCSFQ
jgi:hypothetical protein